MHKLDEILRKYTTEEPNPLKGATFVAVNSHGM